MDDPIEFDPDKEAANLAKHGVSLQLAAGLIEREARIVLDERTAYGERREVAYGNVDGRLYVVVFTRRPGAVRIISMRKANDREVKRYGSR